MSLASLVNTRQIENAVMSVGEKLDLRLDERTDWSELREEQLWLELVSCILGSRVFYETARACARHLMNSNLLDISKIVNHRADMERRLAIELSRPIYPPYKGRRGVRYQYPNSKSNYIIRTALEVYKDNGLSLKVILIDCQDGYEARENISELAVGIGYKQASLFLRNVIYSSELAILDTHIVRYLRLMRLVENGDKLNLSGKRNYMSVEKIFQEYAESNGMSVSSLDIAIWIVMRLVRREFAVWL